MHVWLYDSTNGLTCDRIKSSHCLSFNIDSFLTGFQVILFLLQQNQKYKVIHILADLPHLGIAVRSNGKSGSVSQDSMAHFQVVI
jgi:hypothetical protein